jgi:enoyl-CoA hydratase/carnithine racemase
MDFETLIYEKKNRVVYITLNRPERMNAINPQMERELQRVWAEYNEDDDAWVAVVTGAGERAFCAGADLKELAGRIEKGEHMTGQFSSGARVHRMEEGFKPSPGMNDVWKPVIAAVNGVCAGGGLHFMAECDFAVCSENASFTDPHVSFGLVSAVETVGLTRKMPIGPVMRMVMMGKHERITAQRAYELGLVTEVVPLEKLLPRVTELAEAIAENAPYAVRQTKRALIGGLHMNLRDALTVAWDIVEETNKSADAQEGPRAFAEGRNPEWRLR